MKRKTKIILALTIPTVALLLVGIITTYANQNWFYVDGTYCDRVHFTWEGIPDDYIFQYSWVYGEIVGQGSIECPWGGYAFPLQYEYEWPDLINGGIKIQYFMNLGQYTMLVAPPGHSIRECGIFAAAKYWEWSFGQQVLRWKYLDQSMNVKCYLCLFPAVAKSWTYQMKSGGLKLLATPTRSSYPPPYP